MPSFLLILTLFWFCADKTSNSVKQDIKSFSLTLSNQSFTFDLASGEFQIPAINFRDTIILTSAEKEQIAESFFQERIDTLRGIKYIVPKHNVTMPDSRNIIKTSLKEKHLSELYISTQIKDTFDLSQNENNIYKFHQRLIIVLKANPNYQKCLDTLVKNYKRIPPLM